MVIKVFFVVLLVCVVGIITVALATHYRVKKHLNQEVREAQVHSASEEVTADRLPNVTPAGTESRDNSVEKGKEP